MDPDVAGSSGSPDRLSSVEKLGDLGPGSPSYGPLGAGSREEGSNSWKVRLPK